MYIHSKTSQIAGPGTALVQRIDGLGLYVPVTCNDQAVNSGSAYQTENYGLGCADCKGKCGMGFFDSGVDPSGWGALEWGAVLLGGYMLMSTIFTTTRAARRIAAAPGERRKRKAAKYRKMADDLTRKKKAA